MARYCVLSCVAIAVLAGLIASPILAGPRSDRTLTGWGGGEPNTILPQARAIGVDEFILFTSNPVTLSRWTTTAASYGIKIFGTVSLNYAQYYKQQFPGTPVPTQQMTAREDAAYAAITTDTRSGKGGYQYGGEPRLPIEVDQHHMLCPHAPGRDRHDEAPDRPGLGSAGHRRCGLRRRELQQLSRLLLPALPGGLHDLLVPARSKG